MKKKSMMTYAKASSIPIYKYPMNILRILDSEIRKKPLQMIPSLAINGPHWLADIPIQRRWKPTPAGAS